MSQKKISILIADDNPEISDILGNFFCLYDDIEVCAIAQTGTQVIEMVTEFEPDIVLLDIIMPELDGISVLAKLKQNPPPKMPNIIVVSAIGQEKIAHEAFLMGACYYIIKPFNLDALLKRIYAVATTNNVAISDESIQLKSIQSIRKNVMDIGIPTNKLGYKYIVEAIVMMQGSEELLSLNKVVYLAISKKFDTTIECVERAIRTAIASADKEKNEYYSRLFCSEFKEGNTKCPNSKFLTKLTENIKYMQ